MDDLAYGFLAAWLLALSVGFICFLGSYARTMRQIAKAHNEGLKLGFKGEDNDVKH